MTPTNTIYFRLTRRDECLPLLSLTKITPLAKNATEDFISLVIQWEHQSCGCWFVFLFLKYN